MKKKKIVMAAVSVISVFLVCSAALWVLCASGVVHIGKNSSPGNISPTRTPLPTQTAQRHAQNNAPVHTAVPSGSVSASQPSAVPDTTAQSSTKGIIVLDPGHGISSSQMSEAQRTEAGWIYSSAKGGWGEWRHWKSGTTWTDCQGSGCTGRAPRGGSCWYSIGNGDRDVEPAINLANAMAAKKYLEEMGYTVRLTRSTDNENPSMTQRLTFCYPLQDTTQQPDADIFVCLHSNAGGDRGSYYIALSGLYDQAGIPQDYIAAGNSLGKAINDRIVSETSLGAASGGRYDGYPELVLFCKSPIPIAYLEIGFFDNDSDLAILRSESDQIGKAVAQGINDYFDR